MAILRSCLYEMHKAIYARLVNRVTTSAITSRAIAICGYVSNNQRPPYVVLGEFVEQEASTKTYAGSYVSATIHLVSDFEGMDELHDMSNQVIGALIDPDAATKNRAAFSLGSNFVIVQAQLDVNQTVNDAEGRERLGTQLFTFLIDDANSM